MAEDPPARAPPAPAPDPGFGLGWGAPRPAPFPVSSLVPKSETGADSFLAKRPTCDGRGVRIGVLDTGVDPGAIGLGSARGGGGGGGGGGGSKGDGEGGGSGGGLKLVDAVDCTGSGDVDVTEEAVATLVERGGEDRYWEVKGLTGRTLRLNPGWRLCAFPGGDVVGVGEKEKKEPEDGKDEAGGAEKEDGGEGDVRPSEAAAAAAAARGPVRLGVKRGYELFPRNLARRVRSHRRRAFDREQRRHAASVRTGLNEWRESHPDPDKVTREEARVRDDLSALLEVLEPQSDDALGELHIDDPGPLYDCVVFHDGERFRAAVDVNEDGDLTEAEAMTDFRAEKQYGTFGSVEMYNYAVNIYEGGTVLSIVCDSTPHGSHVAGIAAGFHPTPGGGGASSDPVGTVDAIPAGGGDEYDDDEDALSDAPSRDPDAEDDAAAALHDLGIGAMSGIAPGAEIVSLKCGDLRLGGGMETGSSLTRAMIEAVRRGCDVINLSMGEGCALPDSGRFHKLADDLVRRHGIMFVSSAGNAGPALSTVGAPGGTCPSIISVAAYVSPDMMRAQYSSVEASASASASTSYAAGGGDPSPATPAPSPSAVDATADESGDGSDPTRRGDGVVGTTYTWSSVGPASDGQFGVDLTAPGGAVTSVPNWTLRRNQLMNGTSMSSPHAAGCAALLISACRAEGIDATPARVRRAMENTAGEVGGLSPVRRGWGMIRVERAWEYLREHRDDANEDVYFRVHIDNRPGHPQGVYLRQPHETSVRHTFSAFVDPKFRKDDVDPGTQALRVRFEMRFNLRSTVPWVKAPEHLALYHGGRSFKFQVDPTGLEEDVVHAARILGYDSEKPGRGPMFSVPITVVRPREESQSVDLHELEFEPAEVKRFFLSVPAGATWMDVSIKDRRDSDCEDSSPRLAVMHAVQLLPHRAYRDAEVERYIHLTPSQLTVTSVPVHACVTCELALARYWSTGSATRISAQVQFRGVRPVPEVVNLFCGDGGARVELHSQLRDEMVLPSAKLTKWKTCLRPKSEGIISPLGDRDIWPSEDKRIHQLVLTYEFNQEEAGSFIPRVPSLQGFLYESAYESQLILVFDGDKRYLGAADSWPGEVKTTKGTVTIRLQVRHDKPEMLEKLKDLPIWIERKLSKEIPLSVYTSHAALMIGKDTMRRRTLRKGTCTAVFFAEPLNSKLPSGCKCGDILEGPATYAAGEGNLPGEGKRPGGFLVKFVAGPKMETKNKDSAGVTPDPPDERSVEQKIEEAVRGVKVKELEKLLGAEKDAPKFEELYSVLRNEYTSHLPLLVAGLKFYDHKARRMDNLETIVDAADEIVKQIPEMELAAHFGTDYDKEDPMSCKERKEMEEKKKFLIEALARKARALADMGEGGSGGFDATLKHLKKWLDIDSEKKYAVLVLEREKKANRPGAVLKLLNALLKNKGEDTKEGICPLTKTDLLQRRADIFQELGFSHLSDNDKTWRVVSAPKKFALF